VVDGPLGDDTAGNIQIRTAQNVIVKRLELGMVPEFSGVAAGRLYDVRQVKGLRDDMPGNAVRLEVI
jgi:hypothetical protein